MWSQRDRRASKMNHQQPHQRRVFIQTRCVYMAGLGGSSLYEPLPENQMISYKYCSQLDHMNAELNKWHLELVNRKHIIFHQETLDCTLPGKNCQQPGWEVLIHPPYSPDIAPSDFHLSRSLQNSLNGKNSIPWKTAKGSWNSCLLKKTSSLGRWNPQVV